MIDIMQEDSKRANKVVGLLNVHEGISWTRFWTNLLQWRGRMVIVELQSCALNVDGTPFAHPVSLQIASPKPTVMVNSPHLHCGAEDSIPQLASVSGKGVEVTGGAEYHIKSVTIALNTALEVVRRKADRFFLERRGEAKFWSSPMRRVHRSLLSQM